MASRKRKSNLEDDDVLASPTKRKGKIVRPESPERPSSGDMESVPSLNAPARISDDPVCQKFRDSIDFSVQIDMAAAKANTGGRPVRVYADGVYDLCHSGHARLLMQAKNAFPNVYLIVGVADDDVVHRAKCLTVVPAHERLELLRHFGYVSEVVRHAPFCPTPEFVREMKIDFVAHDDLPYNALGQEDVYSFLKEDGRFVATQRSEGISTTDVITRIIRDYDMYVRRNLLRGYTAKDLNVSFMREKKLQFQSQYDTIKSRGKDLLDRSNEMIQKWEDRSRECMTNFIEMFSRDRRLTGWVTEGKERITRAISPPANPVKFQDTSDEEEYEQEEEDDEPVMMNGDSDATRAPSVSLGKRRQHHSLSQGASDSPPGEGLVPRKKLHTSTADFLT